MSVRSQVRKATKAVGKALNPEPAAAEDTDILATLKKEHDEVTAEFAKPSFLTPRRKKKLSTTGSLLFVTKKPRRTATRVTSSTSSQARRYSVSKQWVLQPQPSISRSPRC